FSIVFAHSRPHRMRERGSAPDEGYTGAHADVAQLARASACHAEGRGFESHHPLRNPCKSAGGVVLSGNDGCSVAALADQRGRNHPLGTRLWTANAADPEGEDSCKSA